MTCEEYQDLLCTPLYDEILPPSNFERCLDTSSFARVVRERKSSPNLHLWSQKWPRMIISIISGHPIDFLPPKKAAVLSPAAFFLQYILAFIRF